MTFSRSHSHSRLLKISARITVGTVDQSDIFAFTFIIIFTFAFTFTSFGVKKKNPLVAMATSCEVIKKKLLESGLTEESLTILQEEMILDEHNF